MLQEFAAGERWGVEVGIHDGEQRLVNVRDISNMHGEIITRLSAGRNPSMEHI